MRSGFEGYGRKAFRSVVFYELFARVDLEGGVCRSQRRSTAFEHCHNRTGPCFTSC